jgi:hypothetical protein
MLVTRRSPLTGIETTMNLPITKEQVIRYQGGRELIQDVFPNLTPAQREFIKSGYTEADWNKMFPPEKED